MADRSDNPVHPATAKRRQQARTEGLVAKSSDLTAAVMLIGALLTLSFLGPGLVDHLVTMTRTQLAQPAQLSLDPTLWTSQWSDVMLGMGKFVAPILAAAILLPLGVHLVQTRFLFRLTATAPDWSRIDPAKGMQRILSSDGPFRTTFGILKAITVGSVVLYGLYSQRSDIVSMTTMDVETIPSTLFGILLSILMQAAAALLALAILDYFYQRWKHERDLMMTNEELREELREEAQRRKQPVRSA